MSRSVELGRTRMGTRRIILVCGIFILILCLGVLAIYFFGTNTNRETYHLGWVGKYGNERIVSPTQDVWNMGEGIKITFTTKDPSHKLDSVPLPIDFYVHAKYSDNSSVVIHSAIGKTEGEFMWVADQQISLSVVLVKHEEGIAHISVTYMRFSGLLAPVFVLPPIVFQLGALLAGGIDIYILLPDIVKVIIMRIKKVSSEFYLPPQTMDFHYYSALMSRLFIFGLSFFSKWVLLFIGLLVILEIFLSQPFYAFILGLVGSTLSAIQLRIDEWIDLHPVRGRFFQIFLRRCSEVPSTPFILSFMTFLMSAAIALVFTLPFRIADSLAVYAYYFLVIGISIQLAGYVKLSH